MDKNNFEQDSWEVRGSERKLTLKQRLIILSRRERLLSRRNTLALVSGVTALLLVVLILAGTTGFLSGGAEPIPEEKGAGQIQLSFVGDMNLGRYVRQYGESKGYDSLFENAKALWANSDAVFANLECAVGDGLEPDADNTKQTLFSAETAAIRAAADAGINAVSLANDHSMDYGESGMLHTMAVLEAAGITYAGGGLQIREAVSYRLVECGDRTVAFIAFSDYVPSHFGAGPRKSGIATSTTSDLYRNVRFASDAADLVVVYAHWGRESKLLVNDKQRLLAHQLVESGADIVIGSHPHVLQNVELYQNGIIFYSLGNFISDQGTTDARNSVMVQLNYDAETDVGDFTLIPLHISELSPKATGNALDTHQIRSALTRDLDEETYTVSDDGRIHITLPFSGNQKG